MKFSRSSGILLHPTSLPGPYGVGDLGPQARRWIDFLAETGTRLWQILPLGPTGYGDSPYQTFSTFAGNPLLISPADLVQERLLHADDVSDRPDFNPHVVDYGEVIYWKLDLLGRSFLQFQQRQSQYKRDAEAFFLDQEGWLDDYALFMALKEHYGGKPWTRWETEHRDRDPAALDAFQKEYRFAVQRQKYFQYVFHSQWEKLLGYAKKRGVKIIGDLPIFIAHDSADAWANRELFHLGPAGQPTVVAGVPPDYFSETGQLWGNPLYRWEIHQEQDYSWWMKRMRSAFNQVDIVRLDHFRGFVNYWEIPAGEETAVNGRWVTGPGAEFLNRVQETFDSLPIITEDLGEISPEVYQLRDQFNLPGMKILVFAFDSGLSNEFLPHHYPENCVVYTGTHDNDTALGWFKRVGEEERNFAVNYLGSSEEHFAWDLIKAAWASRAVFAIAPLQDLLGLDNRARMNYPGHPQGNWRWRFTSADLTAELKKRIRNINRKYERAK